MYKIPKSKNKNAALRLYLETNKNDDEGDSWIFGHNPRILNFLDTYSVEEYENLKVEIENWNDEILCHLADIIVECSNEIIDGGFIYCKIFTQINDVNNLEYLIENLAAYVYIIKGNYSNDFYAQLLQKTKKINKELNNSFNFTVEQINEKMKHV